MQALPIVRLLLSCFYVHDYNLEKRILQKMSLFLLLLWVGMLSVIMAFLRHIHSFFPSCRYINQTQPYKQGDTTRK